MGKTRVRVGMLGAGFIGQMHSLAFRCAGYARAQPRVEAELAILAEPDHELALQVAGRYDWQGIVPDWRDLIKADLGLFINAGPNVAHREPTIAAAAVGIPVFCEKPLASTADEAYDLYRAVHSYGVVHRCGFMHRFIPAVQLARELVRSGELGEIRHFRSTFLLDMADPSGALSWRFDRDRAGVGALGDLGSHHIDIARFVIGEIAQVASITKTWSSDPTGRIKTLNDDAFVAIALLENGATAVFEASRTVAAHGLTGRFEIDGTKGSLAWNMERLNELVIREPGKGSRTQLVTMRGHPFDGFWLPGGIQGSHPVGWNECFAHQAHDILALAAGEASESLAATFEDGYRVAEIVDTIDEAAAAGATRQVVFRP